jgi:hypothetical protein
VNAAVKIVFSAARACGVSAIRAAYSSTHVSICVARSTCAGSGSPGAANAGAAKDAAA